MDILFCAALSIIEFSKEKLLSMHNTFDCTSVLKENLHLIPHKEFVASTMKFKSSVSSNTLDTIRRRTFNEQKRELGEIQLKRDIHTMMGSIPCSFCFYLLICVILIIPKIRKKLFTNSRTDL